MKYLRKQNHRIILCAFFLLALSQEGFAAMPPVFKPGRLILSVESEYFWTKKNFDEFGESVDLLNDNSYKNLSSDFDGTLFLNGDWAVSGGVGFAYAESTSLEKRTNSQLKDVHIGVQKQFSFGRFRLIPELRGLFALAEVDQFGDDVLTGEGVNVYTLGSWFSAKMMQIRGYGYAGYEYRDGGRSSLLPWTVGLGWRHSRWSLAGEVGGFRSVTDDEFIDQRSLRTVVSGAVNGGSFRYYGVNPNLTEARLLFDFNINRSFRVGAGFTYTLSGESTAQGQSALLALAYNMNWFGPEDKTAIKANDHNKTGSDQLDRKFKPQIEEDYDESLFQNNGQDGENNSSSKEEE